MVMDGLTGERGWAVETRRDLLHAYKFAARRSIASLVTAEPDAVEPPMRRLGVITISGVMIAILIAAVYALIGLIKPGSGKDWDAEGAIVVERETGARYVVIGGKLNPALNYPSAVLASGAKDGASVTLVARSDLAKLDRGKTIGIPGLPDSMPPASKLVNGPIEVCSRPVADGVNVRVQVTVDVGAGPTTAPVGAGEAVYVTSLSGEQYLLSGGQRHQVIGQQVANALGLAAGGQPLVVGSAFLTAVPEGNALRTPTVPDLGAPGLTVGGRPTVVGQLLKVSDGTWRVVLKDGVAGVSAVQADLLQTVLFGGNPKPALSISGADSNYLPPSKSAGALTSQFTGLPDTVPQLSAAARSAGGVCATYGSTGSTDALVPVLAVPTGSTSPGAPTKEASPAVTVTVRPGTGVLATTGQGAAVDLITEPGSRYPAASQATLNGFGYGSVKPVQLPDGLLQIIPLGAALDPAQARQPH